MMLRGPLLSRRRAADEVKQAIETAINQEF